MFTRFRSIAWLMAVLLAQFSSASLAKASAPARAEHQQQALAALHHFGRGYAVASLNSTEFKAAAARATSARSTVKLANGNITVTREGTRWLIYGLQLTNFELQEFGPTLGAPVNQVISIYGTPSQTFKDRLVYPGVLEICEAPISFLIDKGQLRGVQWDWCYD